MKVFRLEHIKSSKGPFTQFIHNMPTSWMDSHFPPMCICSPVHYEYIAWIKRVSFGEELPHCYHFAFSTLSQLERCLKGYQEFPQLVLMEYTISTSDEDCCILSDGQVIFSEVISKRIYSK